MLGYRTVFWTVFVVTTIPFIIDRFVTNVWPRQWFATEGHGTGTDRVGYKPGPWSVIAYQVIARFSGRYTMAALNGLFFTMMHTTHFFLSGTWVGRKLIDFSDDSGRMQIHRWLGISICIVTLLHVWSIIFPPIFSGYALLVVPGYFSWPISEQAPKGFKDVNNATQSVMMQADDVYRLILMNFLLIPLIIISIRLMCSNYRIGIRIHQFIMLMYFVDIWRRHTHPHSWIFNTPFLFAWLLDRVVGKCYRHQKTLVQKIMISQDYMLIYWKSKFGEKIPSIGDVFNMRCTNLPTHCCCVWEREHPFTTFNLRGNVIGNLQAINNPMYNKLNLKLKNLEDLPLSTVSSVTQEKVKSMSVPSESEEWDRASVLRTYTGRKAQTRLMRETKDLHLDIWGSFRTGDIAHRIRSGDNVVLIGGGSGSGYLIDTIMYLLANRSEIDECQENVNKADTDEEAADTSSVVPSFVGLVFTSNDLELVQWWVNIIDDLLLSNKLPHSVDLKVTIALTTGSGASHTVSAIDSENITWGEVILGRCNFGNQIETWSSNSDQKCHVFCQGGVGLQDAVRNAAKKTCNIYHEGHSFDNATSNNKNGKGCSCLSTVNV